MGQAGYRCYAYDIQHDDEPVEYIGKSGAIYRCWMDLSNPDNLFNVWDLPELRSRIKFVAAFPPCDHLAVSGARWFKGKGLRKLQEAIGLFATAAEFCEWSGAPYCIENPVSTISTYWRKPDHTFHPHDFTGYHAGDNYTKKTCLWVGNGFTMPGVNRDESLGEPDNRIHAAAPSPERANFRSMTPQGFATAVFLSNEGK